MNLVNLAPDTSLPPRKNLLRRASFPNTNTKPRRRKSNASSLLALKLDMIPGGAVVIMAS